jgi:hypothetical protein
MSVIRKILILLGGLFIILIIAVLVFLGPLFRAGLKKTFTGIRETQGIDVSFKGASLSLGGAVSIDELAAVDLESKTSFMDVKQVSAQVGLLGLLSNPMVVEEVRLLDPVVTYFPGFSDMFSTPKTVKIVDGKEVITGEAEPVEPGEEAEARTTRGKSVLIRKGEVKNGQLRYRQAEGEPRVLLAGLDASVQDLSDSSPFAFDLQADLSGESKGTLGLKGKVDPSSFDSDVTLLVDGVEFPVEGGKWPKTAGSISVVLQNNMSKVLSTGKINMTAPPPNIPPGLAAGGPFEVNWKVDSTVENKGAGRVELRSLDLAVHGLKGGPQGLTGSGAYDPNTAQGSFQVVGKEISAPLINTFIEPSLQMRVLGGKAGIEAHVARAGASQPFTGDINLQLSGLEFKDLSGGKKAYPQFKDIGLISKGTYAPESDDLYLETLTARLDDINLTASGKIMAMQDSAKRELDVVIQNDNVDLARVIPLAAPDLQKSGSLTGNAGINVSIKGQTASKKFPILNGTASLKGVTYTPKDDPAKKVGVKGDIAFDTDTVSGQDLDVTLGTVPGKVTFKVAGYNEPAKNLNVVFKGLAIEPLVNLYKPAISGLLLGNLSGDLAATITQEKGAEGLVINYTIDKGVMLTKHPVPAAIVNVVGWEWLKKGFVLTNAKGRIVQDAKGYKLDPLLFMGEKGGFAIKGWVGYDNKLSANVRVSVASGSVDELNPTIRPIFKSKEGSKFAYWDIPMGGTVQRPIPKPGLDTLKDVGLGLLKEKGGEEIQKQLKGLTDKIPGGSEGSTGALIEGVGNLFKGGSSDSEGTTTKKQSTEKQSTEKQTSETQPTQKQSTKKKKTTEDHIEEAGKLLQGFLKKDE